MIGCAVFALHTRCAKLAATISTDAWDATGALSSVIHSAITIVVYAIADLTSTGLALRLIHTRAIDALRATAAFFNGF